RTGKDWASADRACLELQVNKRMRYVHRIPGLFFTVFSVFFKQIFGELPLQGSCFQDVQAQNIRRPVDGLSA
ncbi:MAG TPA: hypothetical protein PLB25_09205, partial [Rhodoferax sp.]|nr:hypothetical protein [Rhodoferax sp.]